MRKTFTKATKTRMNTGLSSSHAGFALKTNPNFDTNAPPFEIRGCKVILGGAFLGYGDATHFTMY